MGECFEIVNSKAIREGEWDDQKVIMRYLDKSVGQLEMRNDSLKHYQQVRFNMDIQPATSLLLNQIPQGTVLKGTDNVIVHGNAIKSFGRWK
jgi:hypothetical protein